MVAFLHVKRWEERNRTNFYWMFLMYTIWKYWNILLQRLYIVQKSWWISSHFEKKIIHEDSHTYSFLVWCFETFCPKIFKNIHLKKTWYGWKFFLIFPKIFQTIQQIEIWYSSKLFLSDFLRHFISKYLKKLNT